MTVPAAEHYVAELVPRELTGLDRVRARLQAGAAALFEGWVPDPRTGEVLVRARTSSTPVLRLPVDHHEAAGLLGKVQDDLDRLDTEAFHREWGL